MNAQQIQENYMAGEKTFLKLFNMPKTELLELLKEICGTKVSEDVLENSSNVYKEITNDVPQKLIIASWDKLEITPFGIKYVKEHGQSTQIIDFNKFFTIP